MQQDIKLIYSWKLWQQFFNYHGCKIVPIAGVQFQLVEANKGKTINIVFHLLSFHETLANTRHKDWSKIIWFHKSLCASPFSAPAFSVIRIPRQTVEGEGWSVIPWWQNTEFSVSCAISSSTAWSHCLSTICKFNLFEFYFLKNNRISILKSKFP